MGVPVLESKDVSRYTTGDLHLSNAMLQNTTVYGCLETGKKIWRKASCPGENDENMNFVSF